MNEQTLNWLHMEPADAWFFRDGSPYNRGEDHGESNNLFPPAAPTTAGAIRYGLARANGWKSGKSWVGATDSQGRKLETVIGDGPDNIGDLEFQGPFVFDQSGPLFAVPRNLFGFVQNTPDATVKRSFAPETWMVPGKPLVSDLGQHALPELAKPIEKTEKHDFPDVATDFLIKHTGLSKVLNGELPVKNDFVSLDVVLSHEPRVGIARNPRTGAVDKGMLYNPSFLRLHQSCGLLVGVSGVPGDWQILSSVPLGGESRVAYLDQAESVSFPEIKANEKGCFVVSLTPTLFDSAGKSRGIWWGAGPGDPANQLDSKLEGNVLACLCDRPTKIGGWNTLTRGPESLQPFAPAGTVWYLDSPAPRGNRLIKIGHRTQLGFGMALICNFPK